MKQSHILSRSTALLCSMLSLTSLAAVSPEEAKQLQSSLTPIGAERDASADGAIPAWTGGMARKDVPLATNGTPKDPFADEKPLFVIDASNYTQHQDQLSPGQVALLKHFPDTFRLPVYPTHRTAGVSDEAAQAARAMLSTSGSSTKATAWRASQAWSPSLFPTTGWKCCGTISPATAKAA